MLLVPDSKIICLDVSVAAARNFPSGDGFRDNIEKETKSSNLFALIVTIDKVSNIELVCLRNSQIYLTSID